MSERIFFVVERKPGGEFPAIYYDVMPDRLTRKGSTLVVYALRLDKLDDPEMWLCQDLPELYRRYVFARDHNRLVHNLADPAVPKPPTVRKLGEYWEPPAPTWDQSRPFVRPDPSTIYPRVAPMQTARDLSGRQIRHPEYPEGVPGSDPINIAE